MQLEKNKSLELRYNIEKSSIHVCHKLQLTKNTLEAKRMEGVLRIFLENYEINNKNQFTPL